MTHVAFQPRGSDVELDADYVIVGSGAGGASAAVSLARGGASVAVVESGAWRGPTDYPSSAYGGMRDLMAAFSSTITHARAAWPIVQGEAVGGTTVINSAICVRTPGDVFEQWDRDHGVGGIADRMWAYQDELEDELGVEDSPLETLGRSNELALRGADALGYSNHRTRRYVRSCLGSGDCLVGCRGQRKQSLNLTFMPEVVRRGGSVLSCAPVRRVTFDGRRAVGVTGRFVHPRTKAKGARFAVRARRAVLMAASVTASPLLLARSGVRSPALGRYFRAHPGTAIYGWYDDPVDMNSGATQGWASVAHRAEPGFKLETLAIPAELVVSRISGGGVELTQRLEEYRHLAMWVVAVRAESVGRVGSLFGLPSVRYGLDPADMIRLRAGAVLLARTHFAAGARWVITGVHGLPYKLGPDDLPLLENASLDPRRWVGILSHLFGGCVMGSDPQRAVCDERGRVYGYEGLVIADASQIPTNLGVNPQHTIMALARLRAHQLLDA